MKRTFLLLTVSVLVILQLDAQQKMTADTGKSKLEWLGEKVTGKHDGSINLQSGWLTLKDNKIQDGEFIIDMKSITCYENNDKLVSHLKSDDFFSVEKYPVTTLVITGSSSFEKGTATVNGNLTIKGITNPIEFKAAYQKKDDGNWYFANIVVDRTKYNVRYGSGSFFDNLGDKTIYDEFKLKVSLLVK
ncbi:MAG TPA: YceI family protein [Bacteroidales bacterium]|nr:YceI family protein [Bacteroidales bacterium]